MAVNFKKLWYVLPAFGFVAVLFYYPIARLFFISFGTDSFGAQYYYDLFSNSVYINALVRTFKISVFVTFFTLLIGYPIAYVLVNSKSTIKNIIILCVLIPFWSSILVRTYAMIYLLSRHGFFNTTLLEFGLINKPFNLLFTDTGVIIGMTNALLPFMVLPIYVSLQSQSKALREAAHSLGATPARSFVTVTLPLSRPGIYAGALLVFATALGFYVTPALLGGGKVLVAATYITRQIETYVNWPLAAAASVVLLLLVSATISTYAKIVSVETLSGMGGSDE